MSGVTVGCFNNATQVLRSVEEWSAGVPLEHSIMNAWVKAIEDSEHFVFIEVMISSLLW